MISSVLPPATSLVAEPTGLDFLSGPTDWPVPELIPNLSQWQRGDIVLFGGVGSMASVMIQAAQTVSLKKHMVAGRRWVHAAIYVGKGNIVDATFGQPVKKRCLWDYCRHRHAIVRRIDDPGVPLKDIVEIAEAAQSYIGQPYSALEAVLSKLVPGRVPDRRRLICSTLVGLAVAEATGITLAGDPRFKPLFPGTLSTHPALAQIPVEWCKPVKLHGSGAL